MAATQPGPYWPRTTLSGTSSGVISIARSTLTFSSRSASASNRGRRLHRHQADELEEVVLEDVARRAGLLVERAAVLDADRLGHGDLHVVDVAPVPERLEDAVAEAEDQQVADRLLAEVVVDAVDLRLAEDLADLAVEPLRRVQVVPERLLDDDPPPAAVVVLVVEPDPPELGRRCRRTARAGWRGSRGGCRASRAPCRCSSSRVDEASRSPSDRRSPSARSVIRSANERQASSSSGWTRLKPLERLADLGPERLVVVRPATDGQQHELVRQQVGPPQLVEGRDDLAMGEVAGRPEQDQDRRIRDALQPKTLAQDVGGRLRARGALALAREPELLDRQRRVLGPRGRARRDRLVRRRLDRGRVLRPWPCSSAAGSSPRSGRYSVLTSWPPNSLRSAASTLAPYESSWRERKRVSSESVIDRRRDVVVDRFLDRPAPLARIGDVALDVLEVLAVRLERPRRRARAATSGRPSPASTGRRSPPRSSS